MGSLRLLPKAPEPGEGEKCADGHVLHILPASRKWTAYCVNCSYKRRRVKPRKPAA